MTALDELLREAEHAWGIDCAGLEKRLIAIVKRQREALRENRKGGEVNTTGYHIKLFINDIADVVCALGNGIGFVEGVIITQDLTDSQREGANHVLERLRVAGKMIQDKEFGQ